MQNIVIEKPYKFTPPHRGDWWCNVIQYFNLHGNYLRKTEGVVAHQCRNVERLKRSLDAGHGILLAPNHCRNGDPLALGWLSKEAGCHLFTMASWHLFNRTRFTTWAIRILGAFSINREGVDRQSINTAIGILESGERPLVIFPEGAVTRTNDRLHAMLDGVAFIVRAAAKKRAKIDASKKVVVHPIALKYFFKGDIESQVNEILTEIEQRLSWRPQRELPLLKRITKVGEALLCLKELEYFGDPQPGSLRERLAGLTDRLLGPLEEEWLGAVQEGAVVPRVKDLRVKILPDMVDGKIDEPERQRRWVQLADIYLAQQVSCYLPDYLARPTSVDRLLETIQRFEEDLTDTARVHGDLEVVIDVGEPIEVPPGRDRSSKTDPVMVQLETALQSSLDELAKESRIYEK